MIRSRYFATGFRDNTSKKSSSQTAALTSSIDEISISKNGQQRREIRHDRCSRKHLLQRHRRSLCYCLVTRKRPWPCCCPQLPQLGLTECDRLNIIYVVPQFVSKSSTGAGHIDFLNDKIVNHHWIGCGRTGRIIGHHVVESATRPHMPLRLQTSLYCYWRLRCCRCRTTCRLFLQETTTSTEQAVVAALMGRHENFRWNHRGTLQLTTAWDDDWDGGCTVLYCVLCIFRL